MAGKLEIIDGDSGAVAAGRQYVAFATREARQEAKHRETLRKTPSSFKKTGGEK